MSYDIHLTERASGETIKLPIKHMMTGGTYQADYDEKQRHLVRLRFRMRG